MLDHEQYGQKITGGWFDDRPDPKTGVERHLYRNEKSIIVPSSTQILAIMGFTDLSKAKQSDVDRKRKIGSAVHAATQFIDQPQLGELDWDTVHESCALYVLSYERTVETMNLKPVKVESACIAKVYGMEYGVRLDRRGFWGANNRDAIWELKCTAAKNISWKLQTASQALAEFPDATDSQKEIEAAKIHRFALRLRKEGGVAEVDEHPEVNDFRYFISALSLTHYKLQNKYKLPEIPEGTETDDE